MSASLLSHAKNNFTSLKMQSYLFNAEVAPALLSPCPSPSVAITSTPSLFLDLSMAQEARYAGGPRPPIDRRSTTRDDLDDSSPSPVNNNLAERLFTIALSGNFADDFTRLSIPDTTSRRWALDPETEQKWRHTLQLHHPFYECSSRPSSSIDARVPFFGPREPLRRSRASPITPRTPYTPFTPDTPELETPYDDEPGPRSQPRNQKLDDVDSSDDDSVHKITPFPLWKYPIESTPSTDHHHITELDSSRLHQSQETFLSYVSLPVANVTSRQSDGRSSLDSDSPSETQNATGSPHVIPRAGSVRPRLSIVTQVSRSRESTISKGQRDIITFVPVYSF